jgi:hypothetical protein
MGFGVWSLGVWDGGKELFLLWVDFFEKLFARLYMVVHISLFTFLQCRFVVITILSTYLLCHFHLFMSEYM